MNPNTAVRLALTSTIIAIVLLCAYITGHRAQCSQSAIIAAPAMDPPLDISQSADADNKARQAARDFIKENYPNTKSDGVFLLPLRADNLYLAGVDTSTSSSAGTLRQTVDLLVRQYMRKNGSTYWRAESLGPGQAAQLLGSHISR